MSRGERAAHQIERPELYEHKDVSPAGVIYFLIGLGLTILISLVFLFWYFNFQTARRAGVEPFPTVKKNEIPPEPRIQIAPSMDLGSVRAHEDATLETYGWVDRKAGTVRIPIGRAMDLLAQRGLPARKGSGPEATSPETGPESGGPQTGQPVPRYKPAQPSAATEASAPLQGAPESVPTGIQATPNRMPTGGTGTGAAGTGSAPAPSAARPGQQTPAGPGVKGALPPGTPGQPGGPGGPPPKQQQKPGTRGPATSRTGATPARARQSAEPNTPAPAPPQ